MGAAHKTNPGLFPVLLLLLLVPLVHAPTKGQPRGTRTKRATSNGQIRRIVAEISPQNIEKTIRKLVSFGTRNTLSDQNDPNHGIGAERELSTSTSERSDRKWSSVRRPAAVRRFQLHRKRCARECRVVGGPGFSPSATEECDDGERTIERYAVDLGC